MAEIRHNIHQHSVYHFPHKTEHWGFALGWSSQNLSSNFSARIQTPPTARAVSVSVINRSPNWNVHVSWWATPKAFYVELHNTVFKHFAVTPGGGRCVGMQNDERYELPLAACCPSFNLSAWMQPSASFPHRCQLACTYQTTYHISIRLKLIQWLLPEAHIQTIPKAFNPTHGTCVAHHTEVYCSQGKRSKDSCFLPLDFMKSD
jgi:hypothetical protein